MKECSKCKEFKNESEFYKDRRTKDGLYSSCKQCHNKKQSKSSYKYANLYKEYKKEYQKEYAKRKEQIDKIKCRQHTHYLVYTGKIKKESCVICNNDKVEAHHKDYNKPNEVTWLCRKHHDELHKLENN